MPLDRFERSSNLTFENLNTWVHIEEKIGTHCYVLFIPECAYAIGSRTFTQFDIQYQHDARLFELFCCFAFRKNGVYVVRCSNHVVVVVPVLFLMHGRIHRTKHLMHVPWWWSASRTREAVV